MIRTLALALLASTGLAQNISYFAAALEGAQEVPPVATAGRGWAAIRFDSSTNGVRIFVFHESLSGAPTAAHLHIGAAGANGGVIVPLSAVSANTFSGTGTLTGPQATALTSNGTYCNVHTAANPGGEIRGQVVTAATTAFTGQLSATNEVPPNASAATGTVTAFLHEPENRVVYLVDSTGLVNVTAAHIHQAAAGVNGPVIVPLNGSAGNYCGVSNRLTAAQVAALNADGMYVNIHTAANPGGEIRAQLIKDQGNYFRTEMRGANEVPPTPSNGFGSVRVTIRADGTGEARGAFANLTVAATAAHIHFAPAGANGGIVVPLTISGNTLSATFTPSAADLNNLRAGNWYVNVHTGNFPGGEIRGQLGPSALATTYGEGCPGSNGTRPQIATDNSAVLAAPVGIDLYGAATTALAVLALGPSRDNSGAVPLPVELTTAGIAAPRCFVLADPVSTAVAFTNGFGCAKMVLNLPLAPALRGALFYGQWFVFDSPTATNPSGIVTSSALTLELL